MKTFTITTEERVHNTYQVEAESQQEAERMVLAGEVDTNDQESLGQTIIPNYD